MKTSEKYKSLIIELSRLDIKCVMMRKDQLVISNDKRKSAWLTCNKSDWFIVTWKPERYKIYNKTNIVDVCKSFLDDAAPSSVISDFIVNKYNLEKMND